MANLLMIAVLGLRPALRGLVAIDRIELALVFLREVENVAVRVVARCRRRMGASRAA